MTLIVADQPGIVVLGHALVRPSLGLVAGAIALYLTVRSVRAFASHTASGLAAVSLTVVASAFWVAGIALFLGPIPGIVLAFASIAAGDALGAYWFPSARPYCVALALASAAFVFLFATGLWLPVGEAIGQFWSTV